MKQLYEHVGDEFDKGYKIEFKKGTLLFVGIRWMTTVYYLYHRRNDWYFDEEMEFGYIAFAFNWTLTLSMLCLYISYFKTKNKQNTWHYGAIILLL